MTTGNAVSGNALVGNVVLFGRMLRRAGLSVDADQTRRFADVLALLGFDRRGDVKAAGRAVFVRRREDRAVYDAAFDLFWRPSTARGAVSSALPRLRQKERPLTDVAFAPALAGSGAPVEVFVFGTRLTRITRELRVRDPDAALERVAGKVVDWSGGTRIGASLHELNRRWVRRTIRSSAVVIIVSDGWERDDPAQLAREMAMLRRSCRRLIWLDPLAGRPGFEPSTQGLVAALPHVDAFVACANVASLAHLAERLQEAVA